MKKLLIALFLLMPSLALAQTVVTTKQYGISNPDNQSSTIAVTSTFQQVFAASTLPTGRSTCAIQNNGSNPMYVFFGATADATIAKSVKLSVGQAVNCDSNGTVIKSAVQITGTATETYYATQW